MHQTLLHHRARLRLSVRIARDSDGALPRLTYPCILNIFLIGSPLGKI